MSNFAACMLERYGYEMIEHDYGFLTYRIDGATCNAVEIFVPEINRGSGFWQMLWEELLGICRIRGATKILGFVDLTKADPMPRLRAYLRYGAKVIEAQNNIITLEWSVPDGT